MAPGSVPHNARTKAAASASGAAREGPNAWWKAAREVCHRDIPYFFIY